MWPLPVAFPMVMAVGGMLGLMGMRLPGVEYGIALSAILLGAAVMFKVRPPLIVAAILVGFFAIFHGHAHGTELPPGQSGLLYSIGFVMANRLFACAWYQHRDRASGRSLRDLLEIVERLENSGVQFISLTEDINTKAASGRLIFHIFAVLAEFERNLIGERTMAGLATARARGRLGGARRKTTKKQDEGMRALWDSGKFTAAELAKQFGISVPTFFRRMRPKSLKKKD